MLRFYESFRFVLFIGLNHSVSFARLKAFYLVSSFFVFRLFFLRREFLIFSWFLSVSLSLFVWLALRLRFFFHSFIQVNYCCLWLYSCHRYTRCATIFFSLVLCSRNDFIFEIIKTQNINDKTKRNRVNESEAQKKNKINTNWRAFQAAHTTPSKREKKKETFRIWNINKRKNGMKWTCWT